MGIAHYDTNALEGLAVQTDSETKHTHAHTRHDTTRHDTGATGSVYDGIRRSCTRAPVTASWPYMSTHKTLGPINRSCVSEATRKPRQESPDRRTDAPQKHSAQPASRQHEHKALTHAKHTT